jgi:hypothetical protein
VGPYEYLEYIKSLFTCLDLLHFGKYIHSNVSLHIQTDQITIHMPQHSRRFAWGVWLRSGCIKVGYFLDISIAHRRTDLLTAIHIAQTCSEMIMNCISRFWQYTLFYIPSSKKYVTKCMHSIKIHLMMVLHHIPIFWRFTSNFKFLMSFWERWSLNWIYSTLCNKKKCFFLT